MITELNMLLTFFDAETMIRSGGLLIICLAVFVQTGLFFTFFIPSGTFLFAGGMLVATGTLDHDLLTICFSTVFTSVAGCSAGYWFGWKSGPLLYKKQDTKFFKQKFLKAAEIFYNKHGKLALSLGMAFPITRTFAPIIAGIVRMNFGRFVSYVFIGSAIWMPMVIVAGYLTGTIPGTGKYINYIMAAILLLVVIPIAVRIAREFNREGNKN
jgi:membrane-associated protein